MSADLDAFRVLETGLAALLLAAMFVLGDRIHPLRPLVKDSRKLVSFAAGMSIAYVFVRLMPELHGAREAFARSVSIELYREGMVIYFVALIGFLAFYGMEHLHLRLADGPESGAGQQQSFRLRIGGFAAYAGLTAYLLVRALEETAVSTTFFAIAFASHFLAVDHSLREMHGDAYQRTGRWVLGAATLLGWGIGVLVTLPTHVVALLLAFVSGAVVMNSAVMELPSEKDGRFVPFVTGGLLFALVLLPLG